MVRLDKITSADAYPCVYLIVNPFNGMLYVGQARNLYRRYVGHRRSQHGQRLRQAVKTHGFDTFEWHVLERIEICADISVLKARLTAREQHYLDLFRSYNEAIGYNICPAADSTLGYKHTEETKKRMRDAHRDVAGERNPNYGKPRSEAVKNAVSQANKGKVTQRRPIRQMDADTGALIKRWESVADASKEIGISITHIAAAARGHRRWNERYGRWYETHTAGGFRWAYDGELVTGRWDKT
jgi:group I intron endonuclease